MIKGHCELKVILIFILSCRNEREIEVREAVKIGQNHSIYCIEVNNSMYKRLYNII